MGDDILKKLRNWLHPSRRYEPMVSPAHFCRPIGQELCDDINCERCRLQHWEARRG